MIDTLPTSSISLQRGTYSYEFLLANKKCVVNADVFRTILDICPRVEGVNFTDVPDDDTTLAFLIKLCWEKQRTLVAIINKCLSGKTARNDKLRKSRIDILWGMFYKENVDYLELIWEDLAYQTDNRKEKRSRRENMPFPRFTKVIINHFLKQHNSFSNLKFQHYYTIKDDGIVCRLKLVRIGEDYQEYGLPIPNTMLTEAIKQYESYQMFIKYSTGQIPPKKSRGKGSQRKKTSDDSQETVDVSEDSKRGLKQCLQISGERAGLLDRVVSLERSNTRLRDTLRMESVRVDGFRRRMGYMEDEFRQIRMFRYNDRLRFRRFEAFTTRRLVFVPRLEELITQRVAEALAAYEANRAAELVVESQSQNGDDSENRKCVNHSTSKELKELSGYKMVREMETNSHKRTIRDDDAFGMSWRELMKLMTEVYCPRNEIQKMETEP
ncbi:hypothetical protein Tco_0654576 [Tanacetum coccineum]|uniref:Uncharacterized protein n=1 Tax=Tanacetum coccineum TaxID=301880 RepID=A0ABQ4X3L1_9ASTR